ncbi:MAG: hypothetical protein IJK81_04430 [Selenomonadaceae bacterium]|nr:hypothetical protein [Selenomonadaceae bacterium]
MIEQKGFATVLGLCLILIVALIVKGLAEAETNHAREISNFEMEQALQNAAESGIYEAAEIVNGQTFTSGKIFTTTKTFKHGEQTINITVEVWGKQGSIANYNEYGTNLKYKIYDENGNQIGKKNSVEGIYFMSRATINSGIWDEKIYRRAYAYIITDNEVSAEYRGKFYFMELP